MKLLLMLPVNIMETEAHQQQAAEQVLQVKAHLQQISLQTSHHNSHIFTTVPNKCLIIHLVSVIIALSVANIWNVTTIQSDLVDLAFKPLFKLPESDCKKIGFKFTVCADYAECRLCSLVFIFVCSTLWKHCSICRSEPARADWTYA